MIDAKGPSTGVIVTGGASGMGKETCFALAEAGRAIAAWDINGEGAEAVAQTCRERYGVRVDARKVDLRDAAAMERALAESLSVIGPVGGLAYVAGAMAVTGPDNLCTGEWEPLHDINLKGPAILSRLMLPELRRNNPGSAIVIVASTNSYSGNMYNPAYCASKAGVLGLVRSLAHGLAAEGIRVNAVCPGTTDTPMFRDQLPDVPGLYEELAKRVPMQRFAAPSEMAYPVRFLLSNEASYITATSIIVDGGAINCF